MTIRDELFAGKDRRLQEAIRPRRSRFAETLKGRLADVAQNTLGRR